jgi:hypothetical protein
MRDQRAFHLGGADAVARTLITSSTRPVIQ